MRRGRRLLLAVGLVALAACGSETSGQPEPSGGGSSQAAPSTSGVVEGALPERPRSFDLSVVDACSLMPVDRRAEFGLDQPPLGPGPASGDPELIQCSISASNLGTDAAYGSFLDFAQPASQLLAAAGPDAVLQTVEANGFAVPLVAGGDDSSCIAVIDTGDEENLTLQANGTGLLTVEQTCEKVTPWVQIALDVLEAQQPA